MMWIWDSKKCRAETLGNRWTEQVSTVCTLSGRQRNRQIQTANNAVKDYIEQSKLLHTLKGAMKRAGKLPARRTAPMPDFPEAHHNPRYDGPLRPS